ncbi:hypothetical protein C2G38_2180080 [Gigaspora rosea]|uniref:Uncharacterized protein n=1 Tax=Gigaspora rosea TaxID=44941 RepID=A0A397VJQ5_9GLOM|nr:hypothetical protein C2G38_2180080 [Gigaspora rosea]
MSLVLIVQSDARIYKTKPRPRKNKSIFTTTRPNKPVKTATTSTPTKGAKGCISSSCPPVKTATTSIPTKGAKACNWSCPPETYLKTFNKLNVITLIKLRISE